jgi:acetate---CoA ligase (ADP-forming)
MPDVRESRPPLQLEQLDRLFRPRSVVLVGASERSIWSTAAHDNLVRAGYSGKIFAVNRNGGTVHGIAAVTQCSSIGEPVDAALLMVPESALIETIADLRSINAAGAVILSAGFAEMGDEGRRRQQAIAEAARAAGVRLLGPNCLGFVNFVDRVPLWTVQQRRGLTNPTIAIVSQSGALASHLEQFAFQQRIGLTHLISTGNEADITIADAVDYLVARSEAKAIALFLETVRDRTAFLGAVGRANSAGKAIVLLKVGASEAAAKAAQAHTGSLVGNDRVFNAMCRSVGAVRVSSLEELLITADLIARIGPVTGDGPGVITMSGGLCEIAVDQAEAEQTVIPALAPATLAGLREKLPDFATPNNPLDVTGAAMTQPDLIVAACSELARDPKVGMISFAFTVPAKDDKRGVSRRFIAAIAEGYRLSGKPGLTISPTFTSVSEEAREMADAASMPYSAGGLGNCLTAMGNLFRWSKHRGKVAPESAPVRVVDARPMTERAVLDHLAVYGVSVVPGPVVRSAAEAAAVARSFDSEVVMKIASPDIQHKTEIGGVALRLRGDAAVQAAYETMLQRVQASRPDARIDGVIVSPMRAAGTELFIGTMRDPQWGPAIAVGLGGIFVELLKDTSIRLLPVSETEALEMLGELRGSTLLDGFRAAPPVNRTRLARTIVAIGNAALALGPNLVSLEVNPILASEDRIEALDGLAIWEDC